MRRLASVAVLLALVTGARAQTGIRDRDPGSANFERGRSPIPIPDPGKPIRLAYLYSDGNLPGTLKAFKALLQERPDLRGKVELTFLTESVLPDVNAG